MVGHNCRLERPGTIVALVHLLQSAAPGLTPSATVDSAFEPVSGGQICGGDRNGGGGRDYGDDQNGGDDRGHGDDASDHSRERARELEKRYLSSVDAAICTSEYTRDRTAELTSVPTLVAPPAGRREGAAISAEAVDRRATDDGPLRVTFVGNLTPRKNPTAVLEALERAERNWNLTVVGSHEAEPAYARTVRDRIVELGVGSRVSVAGEVDDDRLASVLERSHVLAVPSRYEGFGMVYLEAMEFGVVPVASAVGGADEIVADGRNGVLIDPSDTAGLAAVIDGLAADRERLAALGKKALETAAAHPSWSETMADVRAFLAGLEAGESG
ncbi:glycosyltransferase family 1 protein [Natrarchaeobius chitinivorans]|uniref:Glycosyltransferase family 1 protein n=1 Tax=Natrarchaeobius chitinivorans TaxID=1679083 RepID=A0A3N6LYY7_NATCH|nr:glycosyltransferase family 1 protein [Natrarchaeobius chitinivorans]